MFDFIDIPINNIGPKCVLLRRYSTACDLFGSVGTGKSCSFMLYSMLVKESIVLAAERAECERIIRLIRPVKLNRAARRESQLGTRWTPPGRMWPYLNISRGPKGAVRIGELNSSRHIFYGGPNQNAWSVF